MLYRRRKWARLRRLLRSIGGVFRQKRDAGPSAADRRYLDSLSDARLERDLGLMRLRGDRYRPWL
ncbi:MAG TPA: hypothetical protein VHZ56_01140 [Devosia sp.]|jgi:hypothetical protein|nr:hypothetical protein [Devosia sp.]